MTPRKGAIHCTAASAPAWCVGGSSSRDRRERMHQLKRSVDRVHLPVAVALAALIAGGCDGRMPSKSATGVEAKSAPLDSSDSEGSPERLVLTEQPTNGSTTGVARAQTVSASATSAQSADAVVPLFGTSVDEARHRLDFAVEGREPIVTDCIGDPFANSFEGFTA